VKPNPEIKLLVVEDDPFFQRVLQKRLQVEGYQVSTASDGREGMKAIVSFEPDLVISDWMMPQVDGLELCQSVKTGLREAAPYFILLTAKGELSDRLLGLETGADDYLVKPCDQSELMARVRAGLRIVLLTQDLRRTVGELQLARVELEAIRSTPSEPPAIAMCSFCHRVREQNDDWKPIDEVLVERRLADVSHGLCPECRAANYPPPAGSGDAAA
jgi:sigma-B regulation protein RsbU (phosphoserine phosphatase)